MDQSFQSQFERSADLLTQGRWDEVERLAREALAAGVVHPLYFSQIAAVYAKRGNIEAGEKIMEAAGIHVGPAGLDEAVSLLRAFLERDLAEAMLAGLALRLSGFDGSGLRAWPYMNEIEVISVLAALRTTAPPLRALEWGGGRSTFFFSCRMVPGTAWHSVEHDREWFAALDAAPRPSGGADLRLHLVPASGPYQEGGLDDGDLVSFLEYVQFPRELGGEFGFILVDGRARVECLREGWRLLTPDGIMVLHDAERADYGPGHPTDGYSLEVYNPGVAERKAVYFFCKSWTTFQALSRALREILPAFAALIPGLPRLP